MDVQSLDTLHYILIGLTMFAFGLWLFRKDTEIENRRRLAGKAAGELRGKYGLSLIPSLLEDYSVGDYSGMATRVKDIAELLLDPKRAAAEFDEIFSRMLEIRMSDPEGRSALLARIEKLRLAQEGSAPSADS